MLIRNTGEDCTDLILETLFSAHLLNVETTHFIDQWLFYAFELHCRLRWPYPKLFVFLTFSTIDSPPFWPENFLKHEIKQHFTTKQSATLLLQQDFLAQSLTLISLQTDNITFPPSGRAMFLLRHNHTDHSDANISSCTILTAYSESDRTPWHRTN